MAFGENSLEYQSIDHLNQLTTKKKSTDHLYLNWWSVDLFQIGGQLT